VLELFLYVIYTVHAAVLHTGFFPMLTGVAFIPWLLHKFLISYSLYPAVLHFPTVVPMTHISFFKTRY
jgi:hypothetical protein